MEWIHWQRTAFTKLLGTVVIFLLLPATVEVLLAQAANPASACAGLKIEIRVPDDIVRPQSNVLLEMKLTNDGQNETWLPSGYPDYEVRDSQGLPVPRTSEWRAISESHANVTVNVSNSLDSGASLTQTVILDKFFDLRKPGRYAVRLSFDSLACGNSGPRHVTSNLTNFTVGGPSNRPLGSKSGIAISVSASRTQLPAGWAVPLDIVVQNKSTRPLRWAVDYPTNAAPDEFLTGAEVFGSRGEMQPPPKQPNPNWSSSRFRSTVSILNVPPGRSAEQIVLLGDLFDISRPGKYKAKVSFVDPLTNRLIGSNTVSFEVEDRTSSSPLPKQPPFIVTLQSANLFPPAPDNLLICMSNISDHDIPIDNSALKDFASVEAPDGTTAVMNEAALKDWRPEKLKQAPASLAQSNTWDLAVKPRVAMCGGIKVGVIYNLSRPGAYRIRIDRYDEPDAMPGEKLGELPLVHSNWLMIFEPYPASSQGR